MKRRKFITTSALGAVAASASAMDTNKKDMDLKQQVYEFRRYTMKFRGNGKLLNDYLQNALIPALNRHGVGNVGVFTEIGLSEPTRLYIIIPYNSFAHIEKVQEQLVVDQVYKQASNDYHKTENTIYDRYDVWMMKAFQNIPNMIIPKNEERIFELRTYEAYNDDAVQRKVNMFNDEELALFYKVKLNPVFFGHLISGPNMPALTYMLTFKNMEERNKNWADFLNHPDWKRMLAMPKYANTVSKIIKVFFKSRY